MFDSQVQELREKLRYHKPYLFTAGQLARGTGASQHTIQFWAGKDDFPEPVLTVSDWRGKGVRVWHGLDVVLWLQCTQRNDYLDAFYEYIPDDL